MLNIQVEKKYFNALSNLFTPNVLGKLMQNQYSPYLVEVCTNSGIREKLDFSITLGEFYDLVFNFLSRNYRNEYVYKNIIANRILMGKHTINTSQMLTEFRIGKSKADVVLLNGTSTVYEIKTEYDTFTRLEKQIQSYFKAFDHINVITSPNQVDQILTVLPIQIGILALNNKDDISVIRESKSNKKNIENAVLFDSLRKDEYSDVIRQYYGNIPKVPNTQYNKKCKELFCAISPVEAHDLSIEALKKRSNSNALSEFIKYAPHSTIAYGISIGKDKKKMLKLVDLFAGKLYKFFN